MADYDIPNDLLYTTDDEWVRIADDNATIGITDYAQDQLGDIVYVELPERGTALTQGTAFGVIESVKAVSDLIAPVSGKVVSVNTELADGPERVNEDCYGEGWMLEVRTSDDAEINALLEPADYAKSIAERSEE